MLYARAIGAAIAAAASSVISARQEQNKLSSQINDTSNRMELVKTQRDRDIRDLKREGAKFMSRQRQFIARSGAAGTASGQVLRRSAAGEFARGGSRINRDAENKVEILRAKRENLKRTRGLSMLNRVTGVLAPSFGPSEGVDTPQTAIPGRAPQVPGARGISGRRNIGTSKAGGIGGF